jgi:hypothetical protein
MDELLLVDLIPRQKEKLMGVITYKLFLSVDTGQGSVPYGKIPSFYQRSDELPQD